MRAQVASSLKSGARSSPVGGRLREQGRLELFAQRRDRYPVDDLGAERIREEVARGGFRQAPAAQVEHRFVVEAADRRAVRAFDVVGKDLELRLGVDLRLGAEQQVAAR